jgi:hypothetical protein
MSSNEGHNICLENILRIAAQPSREFVSLPVPRLVLWATVVCCSIKA